MGFVKFRSTPIRTSFNQYGVSCSVDGEVVQVPDTQVTFLINVFPESFERSDGRSGKAVIPAGQNYVDVKHGLGRTPKAVLATPEGNMGNVWVTNITSSQFRINVSAIRSSDITVNWEVRG